MDEEERGRREEGRGEVARQRETPLPYQVHTAHHLDFRVHPSHMSGACTIFLPAFVSHGFLLFASHENPRCFCT